MNEIKEIWKDVKGYENKYQVSNLGRVKSFFQGGRIMKPVYDRYGYITVKLCGEEGKRKRFTIHRLVMSTFKPINNMDKLVIDHINAIKTDNRIGNLRWCTIKENNNNPLTRKNISKSQKGRIITKEHKENMKKNHADYTREKHPRAKRVKCITTGKEFGCISDAADFYKIHKNTICKSIENNCIRSNKEGLQLKFIYL